MPDAPPANGGQQEPAVSPTSGGPRSPSPQRSFPSRSPKHHYASSSTSPPPIRGPPLADTENAQRTQFPGPAGGKSLSLSPSTRGRGVPLGGTGSDPRLVTSLHQPPDGSAAAAPVGPDGLGLVVNRSSRLAPGAAVDPLPPEHAPFGGLGDHGGPNATTTSNQSHQSNGAEGAAPAPSFHPGAKPSFEDRRRLVQARILASAEFLAMVQKLEEANLKTVIDGLLTVREISETDFIDWIKAETRDNTYMIVSQMIDRPITSMMAGQLSDIEDRLRKHVVDEARGEMKGEMVGGRQSGDGGGTPTYKYRNKCSR